MSDDRPTRYVEVLADGTEQVVYRASGVGGCIRAMVASARGHQPRPHQQWFQDVLDEGTRMEDEILRQFMDMSGITITDTQPEVELYVGEIEGRRVIIRGHMDGIGVEQGTDTRWVVEAKKFRASTYPKFRSDGVWCSEFYPWQVSIYMLATELPCKFVAGEYVPGTDPVDGMVLIPESIKGVEWHTYVVPPISLLTIKAKVAKVERLINEGYAADETECSGNYPCPFWYLHDEKQPPVELPQSAELDALVDNWNWIAGQLKAHNAKVKTLDAAKKQLAEELRTIIAAAGASASDKFTAGGFSIAWTRSSVPEKVSKGYELDYFTVKAQKSTATTNKKDQGT